MIEVQPSENACARVPKELVAGAGFKYCNGTIRAAIGEKPAVGAEVIGDGADRSVGIIAPNSSADYGFLFF
jgi:hypothetical protein